MSAIPWRAATTRWPDFWPSPKAGWTATACCRVQRNWRGRFSEPRGGSLRGGWRPGCPSGFSVRSKNELAVAFDERSGAHVELPILPDEEQRALGHLLCSLQEQSGVVGAHPVGKRLAFLVVAVAHVGRQHPGCLGRFGKSECRGGGGRDREQKSPGRQSFHSQAPQQPPSAMLATGALCLNKSRT